VRQNNYFVFFGLIVFVLTADFFAGAKLDAIDRECKALKNDSDKFLMLKQKYKSANESKKVLEEITNDIPRVYFSTSVSKKDFSSSNMVLNLLILNGDELDLILKKVINANLKITKLWIEDAELGYMLFLEVSP
jgi:hypothetical protein